MSENPNNPNVNKQMKNEANKWSNISNTLARPFYNIELNPEELNEIGITDTDSELSSESDIDFSEFENFSDNTSFPKDQILANALEKYSSNQPLSPEEQAAIDSLLAEDPKDLEQQILAQISILNEQKLSEQKKEAEENAKKSLEQTSYLFEQSSKTFIASEKIKKNSPDFLKLRAEIDKFQQKAFNSLNEANIYELRARALNFQQKAEQSSSITGKGLSNPKKIIAQTLMEQADKLQQQFDKINELQQQFNEISELQQQFTSSKNSRFIKQIQTKGAKLIQQVEQFNLSVSELQLPVKFKVSNSEEYNSQEILPNLYKIRLNELKEKTNQFLTQLPQQFTHKMIKNMNKEIQSLAAKSIKLNKQAQIATTKANAFRQKQKQTDIKNNPEKLAKAKSLQKQYQTQANELKQEVKQCSSQINELQSQLNQLTNQPAKLQQNVEQQKPLKKVQRFSNPFKHNKSPKNKNQETNL